MKIKGIDIWPVDIPYKNTYTSSRGALTKGSAVIIRIKTDEGIDGIGEASFIFPDRSGETVHTVPIILQKHLAPILMNKDPFNIEEIMRELDKCSCEDYSFVYSKAAIDIALYDIMGKALNKPVAELIGGIKRNQMEVGRSMSIKTSTEMVDDAIKYYQMGYKMLTLKGSADWQADIECFKAVREALPPDFPLEIDSNQAYSVEAAITLLKELAGANLVNLEQPVEWWNLAGMAQITASSPVPITADESVMGVADIKNIIEMKAADQITIKLARDGGIHAAMKMVSTANTGGLSCNMGSKHTFGIGTAAIIHFSAAQTNIIEPLGYGSPLERFVDDVINEDIPFAKGRVSLPEGPGLGVTLNMDKIRKYSNDQKLSLEV